MKCIIFDLDGVIVFTDQFHYKAWKELADEYGIYFDEKINNRLRGVSRLESLEIILELHDGTPFSDVQKHEMTTIKNNVYKKHLEEMNSSDVEDEVRITLKALKEKGYLLAIGSSSQNAKTILKKVELFDEFDAISDGTNITISKPNPEVFLKAAEFLKTPPENCFVVEDAKAGIIAAKRAGMYAIAIGDARHCKEKDVAINKFSELLEIL